MRPSSRAFALAALAVSMGLAAQNFEIVGMGADGSRSVRLTAQPGHRGLDWARDRP